jgi:putative ABC transport system ATP-binding protein
MPAPLVRLSGVTKIYGKDATEIRALDNVDLTIEEGEFVAVMGPSGSGKSTAMNILGCLDTPTSGRYLFEGVDVGELSRDQRGLLRRHYLGFVFQGFNLLRRTTALENVELPLVYRGLKPADRRARAALALKRVGLEGREGHTAAELSGGQQQRVAIARAIAAEPLLLLADEPTGNLDSQRSREIMALLSAFNRESGITIMLVTHDAEMAGFAKRKVQFLDGRIVRDEATEAAP